MDWGWPLAFSADGAVVAGAKANRICLWDVDSGSELWSSPEEWEYTRNVLPSPSARIVAAETNRSDGGLGAVRCWEPVTGRAWELSSNEEGPVVNLAFSPDGSLLAVARYWSLEVWEPDIARLVYRYSHRARDQIFIPATAECRFSSDGTMLALLTLSGVGLWLADQA